MKNLITGIACIIILSVFLVQISSYQVVNSKMLYVETVVNSAVERARQDGCFTAGAKESLRSAIASRLDCDPSEIVIEGPEEPVARGSVFSYSVRYPLKNVVAASGLLGISDRDNIVVNTIKGTAASEYIGW